MRGFTLAAVPMLVVAALLVGCGGGGGAYRTSTRSIVGTWTVQTIGRDGMVSVRCPGTLVIATDQTETCGSSDQVSFFAGGMFGSLDSKSMTRGLGTWSLDGSNLTMSRSIGPTVSGTISYRSDDMVVFRPTSDAKSLGNYVVWVREQD